MGGEWASGAVLVSETWPPAHRNKAISIMQSGWALGYIAAALLAALILGQPTLGNEGWRWLFVAGVLPALFTLWVRRNVHEPESWVKRQARSGDTDPDPFLAIFTPPLLSRTIRIILLGGATQFAYWGVFFWIPAFLARPLAQGGAGMTVVSSLGWIVAFQIGAYLGYLTFGFIADLLGRRNTFIVFMVVSAILVPVYGQMARSPLMLLVLGTDRRLLRQRPLQHVRQLRRRALSGGSARYGPGHQLQHRPHGRAVAPYTIGVLAAMPGVGIGLALSLTSAFFLLAAALTFTLPDRSGEPLDA
jgi:MFS family permease